MPQKELEARIAGLDWDGMAGVIAEVGYARTPALLRPGECRTLQRLYRDEALFRSHIEMAQFNFGEGAYKYFANPLPPIVQLLRTQLYAGLAPIANALMAALGREQHYPSTLRRFLADCHARGQRRPTPLLLHYRAGGYNCLHRDLYGDARFPLQVTCQLSRPERDFEGGAFLLVEQRPRMQSRGEAVQLGLGEMNVFPVAERPVQGRRGSYAVGVRHGVSRLTRGERYALGVIFHDAA